MRYLDTMLDGDTASLETWLTPRLAQAGTVGIRTGFLTVPGVQAVGKTLGELLARGGVVRVVAGGQGEQLNVPALRAMHAVLAPGGDRASLHVINAPTGLHNAKTYYVRRTDGRSEALVGSPNLTWGGLAGNSEAMIVLDSADDKPEQVERVMTGIEAWARHPSAVLVTAEVLDLLGGQSPPAHRAAAKAVKATGSLLEMIQPIVDKIEVVSGYDGGIAGIQTGFKDLDRMLSGLHPGQLVVLASRPGVGKTTLALNLARAAAIWRNLPTGFFTLESTTAELVTQVVSAEARIPLHVLRSGMLSEDDWKRLGDRLGQLVGADSQPHLYFNDTSATNIDALCSEVVALHRLHGLHLVVVDSIQLVTAATKFTEGMADRTREVGHVARRLKELAMDLGLPVVVTSQLQRGVKGRIDIQPDLTDLAESDVIAQVADVVILLHRDDYYDKESPRAGEADLIVAKHRNGATATVTVAAQLHFARFVDMAII